MITVIGNFLIGPNELGNGRYLLDKECGGADVHHVVRKLKDDETEYDAWNAHRSDDAVVVEVDGESARVLFSM